MKLGEVIYILNILVEVYIVREYGEYMNVENIIDNENNLKLVVSISTPDSWESSGCINILTVSY
jgi:hypothetical protein